MNCSDNFFLKDLQAKYLVLNDDFTFSPKEEEENLSIPRQEFMWCDACEPYEVERTPELNTLPTKNAMYLMLANTHDIDVMTGDGSKRIKVTQDCKYGWKFTTKPTKDKEYYSIHSDIVDGGYFGYRGSKDPFTLAINTDKVKNDSRWWKFEFVPDQEDGDNTKDLEDGIIYENNDKENEHELEETNEKINEQENETIEKKNDQKEKNTVNVNNLLVIDQEKENKQNKKYSKQNVKDSNRKKESDATKNQKLQGSEANNTSGQNRDKNENSNNDNTKSNRQNSAASQWIYATIIGALFL